MFTRFFLNLFILILLAFSSYETVTGFFENRNFGKYGKVAETEQIRKYEQSVHTRKSRGHSPDVTVTNEALINFTTADNQKISVNKKLPKDILEKYQRHDQVDIEYLSTAPETTRWVGEKRDVRGSFYFWLVMVVITYFSMIMGSGKRD